MILAGVDEAGRGPVIGPMVISLVAVNDSDESLLSSMGVKDSKKILPSKRDSLKKFIEDHFYVDFVVVSPSEIDEAVTKQGDNLNLLEARVAAKLINNLLSSSLINNSEGLRVFLDCPSVNVKAYESEVRKHLSVDVDLVVEHKADDKYLVVGAASIVAKVVRDSIVASLKEEAGVDFGSGYPSDPKTKAFIRDYFDKFDFFRKSWSTFKEASLVSSQTSLSSFSDAVNKKSAVKKKGVVDFSRFFEFLSANGFVSVPVSGQGEVARFKKDGVTITFYSTGKFLVQGRGGASWRKKLSSL